MTSPKAERRSTVQKILSVVDIVHRVTGTLLRLFGRRKKDKLIPEERIGGEM